MRIKFLVIFSVFFAIAGVGFAKDKEKRPVQPRFVKSKPERIKPTFDKAHFDRGSRERPSRDKAHIERPHIAKGQVEKPVFDKDGIQKPDWDLSLLETRWQTDSQPILEPTKVEKKSDSKVKRGWFRTLRKP